MKVKELIEKLEKCNPEATVLSIDDYSWVITRVSENEHFNEVTLE